MGVCDDLISRQAAIDLIHKIIYGFFDVVDDESEEPINEKDKLLLEVNKAISNGIKELSSATNVVDKELYDRLLKNSIIISEALNEYQAADVVEVVHCKDCKHHGDDHFCCYPWCTNPEEFCSRGERRNDENIDIP